MADAFVGTWKQVDSKNFDDHMKSIGVGFAARQVTSMTKPATIIEVSGDTITVKSQSTFKNTKISFKLGVEFDETAADDRKVKSLNTLDEANSSTSRSGMGRRPHSSESSRMESSF